MLANQPRLQLPISVFCVPVFLAMLGNRWMDGFDVSDA